MNFLSDKQVRHFFYSLIIGSLLCVIFSIGIFLWHKHSLESLLLKQNQAIASYLLKQDVPSELIANALTNSTITEDSIHFLNKIGLTKNTPAYFIPLLFTTLIKTGTFQVIQTLFFILFILGNTIIFLRNREHLYQNALQIISLFNQGNFSAHLPRAQSGTLYRLFASVDSLSNALQSKNETELKSKKFLKNTISDISHQLKTPLAALRMYHEIISEEPDNPQTISDFSQKMEFALMRMEQLICSLLKITRLDAGSIDFIIKPYPIQELIYHSIDILKTRAEYEGKKLILEGNSIDICCDLEWTSEALGNLVKNALDHTKTGDQILISWEETPAMVCLSVSDNGSGILPEDFHHIFKRFYRSKTSLDTQGLGLGLSLAKSIIEGQNGILSVKSTPQIETTFTISLLTKM